MNESIALHADAGFPATSCFLADTSLFTSLAATPEVFCAAVTNASYATTGSIGTHAVLPVVDVVMPAGHAVCDVEPVVDT